MHVSVAFLRVFHSVLVELGLPESALFPLPDGPYAQLGWDECMRRLEHTLSLAPDPALGLAMGERISVPALHVVGHLLLTSRNLREAASQFSQFAPLVLAGASFTLHEDGDDAWYTFEPPPIQGAGRRFVCELALCVTVNVSGALLLSEPKPQRIEFQHREPSYRGAYERVFRCPITFAAAENRVVFARSTLDDERRLPDEALKALLQRHAERLLREGAQPEDFAQRVRRLLRSADLETCDLASCARTLGVSASTLRRRLAERDTAFSELVDEVRKELAFEALREANVNLKELSLRLGFSEPRAFHRAFRRWTGTTPTRFRAERVAP